MTDSPNYTCFKSITQAIGVLVLCCLMGGLVAGLGILIYLNWPFFLTFLGALVVMAVPFVFTGCAASEALQAWKLRKLSHSIYLWPVGCLLTQAPLAVLIYLKHWYHVSPVAWCLLESLTMSVAGNVVLLFLALVMISHPEMQ
jgi:hypothetical protein